MSRPLRVALLATTVHFGGIERVLLMLLRHMTPDVELVPVVFTRTDLQERAFFDRLEAMKVPHHIFMVNTSRAKYANPVRNVAETLALFRRERFDLIHSHGYRADLISLVVARRFRLPVVTTCHGFIANDLHLTAYNRLNLLLLRLFTRVIAVSERMKSDLVAGGVHAETIEILTNAVEIPDGPVSAEERCRRRQALGLRSDAVIFGYVGRLSVEKGLHLLLPALARAGAEKQALVIVGDGDQRAVLEAQCAALGISERVRFVGFQSDPSSWYDVMDAFVLPSLTEGTPLALLEAMAARLPVVATAVGGVPSIVTDDVNGVLVPASSTEALAAALDGVAGDAVRRARLADEAQRSVRASYDVASWIDRTRAIYHRSTAERGTLS
jgi:glycosyltransferase involved in cell wall biosynthesis